MSSSVALPGGIANSASRICCARAPRSGEPSPIACSRSAPTTRLLAVQIRPGAGFSDARVRAPARASPASRRRPRPVRRHARVVARTAQRHATEQRPADVARRVRADEILRRTARSCSRRRAPTRSLRSTRARSQSRLVAAGSCAVQASASTWFVGCRSLDGSTGPHSVCSMTSSSGPAGTRPQRLDQPLEGFPAGGAAVLPPIGRPLDADQVAPVAVTVGESPRDVAVAADDHDRCARAA